MALPSKKEKTKREYKERKKKKRGAVGAALFEKELYNLLYNKLINFSDSLLISFFHRVSIAFLIEGDIIVCIKAFGLRDPHPYGWGIVF
jgi:hypothetical protein